MPVNEQLQNFGRTLHNVGLATWFGGQVFGKFALNPVVKLIPDPKVRGQVINSGWFTFNPIGFGGLLAATAVETVARKTELRPGRLSPTERKIVAAADVLHATSLALTVATGIQGARLARQAPKGRVPILSGTRPLRRTPPKAARLQRSIEVLGNSNLLAGLGLLTMHALEDRVAYTRPPLRRSLFRTA